MGPLAIEDAGVEQERRDVDDAQEDKSAMQHHNSEVAADVQDCLAEGIAEGMSQLVVQYTHISSPIANTLPAVVQF